MKSLALLTFVSLLASAQETYYQYSIDQDRLSGAPDFSQLNHPLGPEDRVFVRDGRFHTVGPDRTPHTPDDKRIRFFGANLSFSGNFPTETDALRIAKRLRRLGINLVRLHHLDSSPSSDPDNPRSILNTDPYPSFHAIGERRLKAFIAALKAEGVYVNLNLHVGYKFRPDADRLPPHDDFPAQSKPLHIFFTRMVELQMDYTRELIRRLGLRDDPVLAMVEVNNETSMLQAWQVNRLDSYLTGEYRTLLQRLWNWYLHHRYRSTEELRATWGTTTPDGPNLLTMDWEIEKGPPSDGVFEQFEPDPPGTVKFVVTSEGPRLNFKKVGFSVEEGKHFVAEIEASAEVPPGVARQARFVIKRNASPWTTMAAKTISVTAEPQVFRLAFHAGFSMDRVGRFSLELSELPAGTTIWVKNAALREAGVHGLDDSEFQELGNISLVCEDEVATDARTDDFLAFLATLDRAYLWAMLHAVRREAGGIVPVAGTQMKWGGLLNLDSHADMDYDDNHFYEDHPWFQNQAWDARDWSIADSSLVGGGLTQVLRVAAQRTSGRPYTLSEFNQAWPNRQGAEIDPVVAVLAAFQDWDGLMHFAYAHDNDWDGSVPVGFDLDGDWSKLVNLGQAAWIFRSFAILPANETLRIPVAVEDRYRAGRERRNANVEQFLSSAHGYQPEVALRHRVELVKDGTGAMPDGAREVSDWPMLSDTGEFSYSEPGRLFTVQSPLAAGVIGHLDRRQVTAGPLTVELGASARGFAVLLVTPLDGRPVEHSQHLLLSNPGYTLRTQPASSPARPQQLVPYPGSAGRWTIEPEPDFLHKPSGSRSSGQPPTWMERVEVKVLLQTTLPKLSVYPLDGSGSRLPPLSGAYVQRVEGGYQLHLQADGQQFSPWYEIAGQ